MKKIISYILILFCVSILFSCSKEQNAPQLKGNATFSLSVKDQNNKAGRTDDAAQPAYILLTIEDGNGIEILKDKKLPLISFGQSYVTDNVELTTGSYKLTQFLILDAASKTIYATPLKGSDLAQYVNEALAIDFSITANNSTN